MEPEYFPERQGRLQRPADFTGAQLTTFQQVFLRHGLPGAISGLLLLFLVPDAVDYLFRVLDRPIQSPAGYLIAACALPMVLFAYSFFKHNAWSLGQAGWVIYLGFLSLWEEWVFRAVGPYSLLLFGVKPVAAVVICNLAFGLMHYFTLRWRWQWCVGAFIGGLGFSMNFHTQSDLLLIAGIHWAVTYLNTPRPPVGGLFLKH